MPDDTHDETIRELIRTRGVYADEIIMWRNPGDKHDPPAVVMARTNANAAAADFIARATTRKVGGGGTL